MRLPTSVVKELLARDIDPTVKKPRFSPEAVEAAGLAAEKFLADLGKDSYAFATNDGRTTVMEESRLLETERPAQPRNDVSDVLEMRQGLTKALMTPPEPTPGEKVPAGNKTATALAIANERLRKAGLEPVLLGRARRDE